MSIAEYTLVAQGRNFDLKPAQLLRTGLTSAVLYGNKLSPLPIALPTAEFGKVFHKAGASSLVALKLEDGTEQIVLIREPQHDPRTRAIIHVDLYAVNLTEKTHAEVPLLFVGEAPALSLYDPTLVTNKDPIEVEALPRDLPHAIEVDLSVLANIDDAITVGKLVLPKGVEVTADPEEIIVLVAAQREEEEEPVVSEADAIAAVQATSEKTEDDNAESK